MSRGLGPTTRTHLRPAQTAADMGNPLCPFSAPIYLWGSVMGNCTQELGLRMCCNCFFLSFLEGNPPEQHPWQQGQLAAVSWSLPLVPCTCPGNECCTAKQRVHGETTAGFFPVFSPLSVLMPQELNTP